MKIETYEVENSDQSEVSVMAQDAEAIELIEKLGLGGQKALLNPETATRNPYRAMTKQEQVVYEALLSQKTKIEQYADDCIPLRVLQVAAHAKECGLFDRVEVWHGDPAVFKDDPLLVGVIKGKGEWGELINKYHMLARWGRELLTLEQLEAIAVKTLRALRMEQCEKAIREAQAHLEVLKTTCHLPTLSSSVTFYK